MNAKRAKSLRAAAGYRNQTATPGTMPFPGIMPRGYQFPVLSREPKKVRVLNRVKGKPRKYIEVQRIVNSGTFARNGDRWLAEPVFMRNKDGTPAIQIMPVSKPGRLNAQQPKGIYRELKRLERLIGLANIVKGEHDWRQLSPAQQEVTA